MRMNLSYRKAPCPMLLVQMSLPFPSHTRKYLRFSMSSGVGTAIWSFGSKAHSDFQLVYRGIVSVSTVLHTHFVRELCWLVRLSRVVAIACVFERYS